ncbi:MAG: sensor histidine kinase [Pseudomonadota bacterium]
MNSIRARLLFWLMLPLAAIAAVVSLETFYSARKISNELSDKTLLAASLTILEHVISTNGNLLAEATLDTLTENLGDQFFYHVSGPSGAFVTGYSGYPRTPMDIDVTNGQPVFYDGMHLGAVVRVVQIERDLADRELNGLTTITTWQRTSQRSSLTLDLFARSLARLVLLVLAAGAIVWFAVRIGLRPLTELQSAIDRRTPYDLNPIRRSMPQELSGITGSMNELFARVARSKSNRERFIGDAAHQLRNPIAAIKVQAEAALESSTDKTMRSGLNQILDVSNSSAEMINKMLAGARAHAMDKGQEQPFDLVAMLRDVVAKNAPNAFAAGHEIALDVSTESLELQGSDTLLKEAASNLIDNAIRYNAKGSQIDVSLVVRDGDVAIEVCDPGPAMSEEQFLQLTQPFLTGGADQNGSGLGLSIAKDIAKSHGGYLTTRPTSNGKAISLIVPRV